MTFEELKKILQEKKAEEEAKQEESMVCPWNGFRPCFGHRCPFWNLNCFGDICGRAYMEVKE